MPVRVWGWLEAFSFLQTVPLHGTIGFGSASWTSPDQTRPVSVWVARVWLESGSRQVCATFSSLQGALKSPEKGPGGPGRLCGRPWKARRPGRP